MALGRFFMQLRPIVAALGRHKVATVLIVMQVALTLAVTSNAMFIVATSIVHLSRPSGTDEAHLFAIRNVWRKGTPVAELDATMRTDLDALRHVTGVLDAFPSQSYPMAGYGSRTTLVKLSPDQAGRPPMASVYHADDHALSTLGVSLIAGRNFRPDEVSAIGPNDKAALPGVIITRSLAERLFPDGNALGKTVFLEYGTTSIIGIVDRLQSVYARTRTLDFDTMLIPARPVDPEEGVVYMVRTDGTDMKPVMAAAYKALQERSGTRIIDPETGIVPITQSRETAYAGDRSVAALMSIVCGLLLLATAGGIVGLSSFWVSQRRKQIGIRRSLGATSGDILGYFHVENFVLVSMGIVLGAVLAVAANISLMNNFPLPRMPLYVPVLGAAVLWLVGQIAVWVPARSAARVPPVVAMRTA
jgi:putative ABC transport system permease protein